MELSPEEFTNNLIVIVLTTIESELMTLRLSEEQEVRITNLVVSSMMAAMLDESIKESKENEPKTDTNKKERLLELVREYTNDLGSK